MLTWTPAEERTELLIGEIPSAPRTWRNGSMVGRPPGEDYHGDPAMYVYGCPPGSLVDRTPAGPLLECFMPAPVDGGVVAGGEASFPRIATNCCPGSLLPDRIPVFWNPYDFMSALPAGQVLTFVEDSDPKTWRVSGLGTRSASGRITVDAWSLELRCDLDFFDFQYKWWFVFEATGTLDGAPLTFTLNTRTQGNCPPFFVQFIQQDLALSNGAFESIRFSAAAQLAT